MTFSLKLLLMALACAPMAQSGTPTSDGGRQVVLNGVRLWYEVAGTAHAGTAPVLYLAGGPGYNSYSFEKTIGRLLEPEVQVIYFDQRGTGRSDRPESADYRMNALTGDIDALRESLDLPQISVMGQSFGGTIALEYAARYPRHVQHVITVDGGVDYPEAIQSWETELKAREPIRWSKALNSPAGKLLAQTEAKAEDFCALTKARFAVVWQVYQSPGMAQFHHWQQFHDQRYQLEQDTWDAQSGLGNTGELMKAYFSQDNPALCYRFTAYDRVTMPVLVIEGKFDGSVDPHQAQTLASHLSRARYDEFTESAHFPYAEEPTKFVHDVRSFLRDTQAPDNSLLPVKSK